MQRNPGNRRDSDDEDDVWNYKAVKNYRKSTKLSRRGRKDVANSSNIAQNTHAIPRKLDQRNLADRHDSNDNISEKENRDDDNPGVTQDFIQDVVHFTQLLSQNAPESQILCQDSPGLKPVLPVSGDCCDKVNILNMADRAMSVESVGIGQPQLPTLPGSDRILTRKDIKKKRKSLELTADYCPDSQQELPKKKSKLSTKNKQSRPDNTQPTKLSQSQTKVKSSKKKKQDNQAAVTPSRKRDGHCPFCQMPFQALSIESPRWHVTECMDLPLNTSRECPSGLSCDNTIPSHFRKFRHCLLAEHRAGAKTASTVEESTLVIIQSPPDFGTTQFTPAKVSNTPATPSSRTATLDKPRSKLKEWLKQSAEKQSSSASQMSSRDVPGSSSQMISPYFRKDSQKRKSVGNVTKQLFPPTPVKDAGVIKDLPNREVPNPEAGSKSPIDATCIDSDDDIFSDDGVQTVIPIDVDTPTSDEVQADQVTQSVPDVSRDKKMEDSDEIEFCREVSDMLADVYSDNEDQEQKDVGGDNCKETICDNSEAHSLEEILTQCHEGDMEADTAANEKPHISDGDDDQDVINVKNNEMEATGFEGHDLDDATFAEMLDHFDSESASTACMTSHAEPSMSTPQKFVTTHSTSLPSSPKFGRGRHKSKHLVPDEKQTSILNFISCSKSGKPAASKQASMTNFFPVAGTLGRGRGGKAGGPVSSADKQQPAGKAAVGRGRGRPTSNNEGGFYRNSNSKCPFYKWIPGTPFTVDAFKYGVIPNCNIYFLSHFHYDHYQGLSKHFKKPIYCSKITANLVKKKVRVEPQFLHVLPLETPRVIEGVEVTLLEANHCPGAVLLLFKLPNGKTVLHTGDFRANRNMEDYPQLQGITVDDLYLDTTYCDPSYAFPPQDEAIKVAVSLANEHVHQHPNTLIVVGSYTIGKERIFLAIAEALNCQIYVTKEKLGILECVDDAGINKRLSPSAPRSRLHVLPMKQLKYPALVDYLSKFKAKYDRILAFEPTGWTHSDKSPDIGKLRPKVKSGNITIYGIPYSEHSSYSEMKRFVQFLRPAKILPTVNNGNPQSRRKMEGLFKSWLYEASTSPMKQTSLSSWFRG